MGGDEDRSTKVSIFKRDPLVTLRPEVVQGLLEACRSIKVKRLFLYMTDRIIQLLAKAKKY